MTRFPAKYDDLAAGPPPEVLAQVDVAWERAREMFDSDMDLHFEVDAELGEVWAELRFADGSLAERLTATEAMDLACGDTELRLAVAA